MSNENSFETLSEERFGSAPCRDVPAAITMLKYAGWKVWWGWTEGVEFDKSTLLFG